MIDERHGRPHIGANGVSDPLEKWMKNEKGKQAEESGFLNGAGWGEVIRVIMFMLYFEQLWHGRPQEGAMGVT